MTIKELMLKLNEFDQNKRFTIAGKKLVIHDDQNDWYLYIRFETEPENTELTHEENIQYLKMCLGIVYGEKTFDIKTVDMFISLFQLIDKKKGETDLQSICEVIKDVQYRFENKTA
jgi:hypothetical protein